MPGLEGERAPEPCRNLAQVPSSRLALCVAVSFATGAVLSGLDLGPSFLRCQRSLKGGNSAPRSA